MLKKQSLISIMARFRFRGSMEGEGKPGCRGPVSPMNLLNFLRLWRTLHLSLPVFFEDKDRGIPRAIGFSDVALGKQLLHKGFQGAQFFLREGPLEDPYQMVLFPGDLGDNGYCTLNSDPN